MLRVFQLLFLVVAVAAIAHVVQKRRSGAFGPKGMVFWILFWLAVVVAVLWPTSTQILADVIGIGRGVDLVIYVAIVTLFYLIFKLHLKIEATSRDMTKLVRRNALEHAEKNNPQQKNP